MTLTYTVQELALKYADTLIEMSIDDRAQTHNAQRRAYLQERVLNAHIALLAACEHQATAEFISASLVQRTE